MIMLSKGVAREVSMTREDGLLSKSQFVLMTLFSFSSLITMKRKRALMVLMDEEQPHGQHIGII